jgi:3-dehydroquinate synthase
VRTRLEVKLPPSAGRSYPIFVDAEPGAEARLADELVARAGAAATVGLLTDETVARLHRARFAGALSARGLTVVPVVVPDGESAKSMARAAEVAEAWTRGGLDRRAWVMALGGGVVGDLGGFVASILFRGVRCVQVPTTLLAQVDASVGGKTAVNLPSGKNLVGTFHQPELVYADVTTLATLAPRDRASGLAEVVKHGVIASPELLELVERRAEEACAGDPALLGELVARSCAIKAEVVAHDEREQAEGGRARLNFGHTVGHALESASQEGDAPLRHGEAVALGMLAAARVGAAHGCGDPTLEARLTSLLERLGLPTDLDRRLDASVLARVGVDKKRAGGRLLLVVVERVGQASLLAVEPARLGEILLAANRR